MLSLVDHCYIRLASPPPKSHQRRKGDSSVLATVILTAGYVVLCLGIFCAQAPARPFLRVTTPLKGDRENRGSQSRLRQYYGSNKMASDRMLRGRSLWGLRGAVYLLVRLRSFARRCEVVDAFNWGSRDVIECCASMLDRTGAQQGDSSSCIVKGYHQQWFSRSHHPM